MKISFTFELIDLLIDYVFSISDPLLELIHRVERLLTDLDENSIDYEVSYDDEKLRLIQVVNQLIMEDQQVPISLVVVLDKIGN